MQNNTVSLEELKQALQAERSMDVITDTILTYAMQITNSDFASIQVYNSKNGALTLLGHKNFHPESERFWCIVFSGSGTACGQALTNKVRSKVNDVNKVDYIAGTGDLLSFHYSGIRSVQSTPLISTGGGFIGVISTHYHLPHDFDEDDFTAFDILALHTADFLEQKLTAITVEG